MKVIKNIEWEQQIESESLQEQCLSEESRR